MLLSLLLVKYKQWHHQYSRGYMATIMLDVYPLGATRSTQTHYSTRVKLFFAPPYQCNFTFTQCFFYIKHPIGGTVYHLPSTIQLTGAVLIVFKWLFCLCIVLFVVLYACFVMSPARLSIYLVCIWSVVRHAMFLNSIKLLLCCVAQVLLSWCNWAIPLWANIMEKGLPINVVHSKSFMQCQGFNWTVSVMLLMQEIKHNCLLTDIVV